MNGKYLISEENLNKINNHFLSSSINENEVLNIIKNIYVEHTKLKKAELTKLLKHDRWWDFSKCKKHGLFDEEWKKK